MKNNLGPILIATVVALVLSSCFSMQTTEKGVEKEFKLLEKKPTLQKSTLGDRTFSYLEGGTEGKPVLIFIHGSPGSFNDWSEYFKDTSLGNSFKLIAVNRFGYGQSEYGKAEPSLANHAYILKPIAEKYTNLGVYLIGHSYGGPVAVKAAIDYPALVDGIILGAPAVSPAHEKTYWIQHFGRWKATRWALPKFIRVSSQEIMPLKSELEAMSKEWNQIQCPVIYIHGKKDKFVPVENADFARLKLANGKAEFWIEEDMNHFIPWTRADLIKKAIMTISQP